MQDYLISRFNSFSLDTDGLTPENLLDRNKKDFQYVEGSKTLVICLPGWGQGIWTWKRVKKNIVNSGDSFLAYEFPREILSNNHDLTRKCFEVIDKTVREDINEMKEKYGFTRCILVAVSLSSSYGSMVYKDNHDINEILLIVPGENLARDMWHGVRTQHLRKSFDQLGIDLPKLENFWHSMASENNLPAKGTNVSLYFGKEDAVIPYKFSIRLADILVEKCFKTTSKSLSFFWTLFIDFLFSSNTLETFKVLTF